MGAEQSSPSEQHPQHNPLDVGWVSTDPITPATRGPAASPAKRPGAGYQPSFLNEYMKTVPSVPSGVRKMGAGSSCNTATDSYMLAHARKAASAIPQGSARQGAIGRLHKPTYGADSITFRAAQKAQQQLSPSKYEVSNHFSHVGADALEITTAKRIGDGEKGVNGITSVFNKFSNEYMATGMHQIAEDCWIQSALDSKKTTTKKLFVESEHVGVKGTVRMDSVENAAARAASTIRAPPNKSEYIGVKPNRQSDDYLINDQQHASASIHGCNDTLTMPRPQLLQDSYMIIHSNKVARHMPVERLKYEDAAATPPIVAPHSYDLMHAASARELLTPSHPSRGRQSAVGTDSYLMSSSRRVAAQLAAMTPIRSKEFRGSQTKLSEVRL